MRVFRHFTAAIGITAVLAAAIFSSGCERVKRVIAKDKLNQGAVLYNQGNTKEAQQYFKDALSWDDKSTLANLFLGATLVKDYKAVAGADQAAEKERIANEAIKVYERALELAGDNCKNRDNAISYIASIYQDLSNKDKWREWFLKRAEGECGQKDKATQAVVYYTVGYEYWDCSFKETNRYVDKEKLAKEPFHYRNMDYSPEASADKVKAETCATKGMEFIEKALAVDPEYPDAMFIKSLLYRQNQMLTKDEAKRKQLDETAKKINDHASELQKRKEEADAAKKKEAEAKSQG